MGATESKPDDVDMKTTNVVSDGSDNSSNNGPENSNNKTNRDGSSLPAVSLRPESARSSQELIEADEPSFGPHFSPSGRPYQQTPRLSSFKTDFQKPNDSKATGMNMAVPTIREAQKHTHDLHGADSLEVRVLAILHDSRVQIGLACMLMLDVCILFTELALAMLYPHCSYVERDAISCCPVADANARVLSSLTDTADYRFLAGGGGGDDDNLCETPGSAPLYDYEAACDSHKWHRVHQAEHVLFWITIVLLSIFLLDNLITLWALRPSVYFRQVFYIFDLFIVIVSLALELTLHFLHEDTLASLGGLLIIGRVWRFVRVSHGLIEVTVELEREKYHNLIEYTEILERKLQTYDIPIPEGHLVEKCHHYADAEHFASMGVRASHPAVSPIDESIEYT